MSYYSKKVLDHFMHPKHMGHIDNADGVGDTQNLKCGDIMKIYIKMEKEKIKDIKFETLGCLPPDEEVLINEGDWQKMSLVEQGTIALNGDGKETRVMRTFARQYKGDMLTIVPFASLFNSFRVTPEHPVFCIKRIWLKSARRSSKKCEWLRVDEMEMISTKPDYVPARDLQKGDYLVFVANKRVKDSPEFNKDMMKLLGYYLAEGYGVRSNGVLYFSFSKEERNNINEVKRLLVRVTGKKAKERIRRTAIEVYICSAKWVRFFKTHGGQYARYKKLSREAMLLPFKKQWEMVMTYLKGDGYMQRRRPNDSIVFSANSASKNLLIQIQEILAKGGIFGCIRRRMEDKSRSHIEGREVNAGPIYEIRFKLERTHKFIHCNKDYFFIPVRKIQKSSYDGMVYNFQVMGTSNSYLVKGFVVHNCGHAIAASDMLCDLALGKTIDEAKKIKFSDIAGELGELPAVKLHCTHLAETALKSAIDDYEKKKK